MKYFVALFVLLTAFLLCACAPAAQDTAALLPKTYALDKHQVLRIEVNMGEVLLTGSQNSAVEVLGSLSKDPALVYSVEQNSAGLRILAQYPKRIFPPAAPNPIDLEIRIPAGYQVQFDSLDANLRVQAFSGRLDVSSVSGDVSAQGLSGFASIKANRGDVSLQDSQGELYALGNYGLLSFKDVHGAVNAATIMGSIHYQAAPQAGDALHFESDHGPVTINLAGSPNLLVEIHSTSGDVVCMFAALTRDPRNCSGALGGLPGSSRLDVRTVSGAIMFQPWLR